MLSAAHVAITCASSAKNAACSHAFFEITDIVLYKEIITLRFICRYARVGILTG